VQRDNISPGVCLVDRFRHRLGHGRQGGEATVEGETSANTNAGLGHDVLLLVERVGGHSSMASVPAPARLRRDARLAPLPGAAAPACGDTTRRMHGGGCH
jgi:hypothetical protein